MSRLAARAGRRVAAHALCTLLLSGGAMMGLCRGASAQFIFEEEVLPPRVVAWRLADHGYTGINRPRFDGRVYVVDAVSPTGVPVRLFVDPAAGAIVGRQRLGPPETYARLERPAPGFGWTEEEAGPGRIVRPLPPGVVPTPTGRVPLRQAPEALRPEANPDGLNPDARSRPAQPRKVARAAAPGTRPEPKPAVKATPEAPAPKIEPAEESRSDAKVDARTEPKADLKPAAQPGEAAQPGPAASDSPTPTKPAAAALAEAAKPSAKDWKDPPADKKPVRVIGGATVVPGTADKEPAPAP